MNQKDAVYEAIKQLKPTEVDKEKPVSLSKQEKKVVEQKLFEGFRRGKIEYNSGDVSDDKLVMYVSGLVSNWLRKDRRLNGNTTYTPKRGGSRIGWPQPVTVQADAPVTPEQLEAIQKMAGPNANVTVVVIRRPAEREDEKSDVEKNDAVH